jgi:hypothetical protein
LKHPELAGIIAINPTSAPQNGGRQVLRSYSRTNATQEICWQG